LIPGRWDTIVLAVYTYLKYWDLHMKAADELEGDLGKNL
jgi:hypothetical protein